MNFHLHDQHYPMKQIFLKQYFVSGYLPPIITIKVTIGPSPLEIKYI